MAYFRSRLIVGVRRSLVLAAFMFLGGCAATQEAPQPFADGWAALTTVDGESSPWSGPDWHAARVQDWSVRDGEAVCLDARPRFSGRTLALLTRTTDGVGRCDVSVDLRAASAGAWKRGAHAGLLFGVGGSDVHWMRSALVQQAPAPDGGFLLSVNHQGRLRVSRFDDPGKRRGYWTIPGKVDFDQLPLVAESAGRLTPGEQRLRLNLTFEPDEGDRTGTLTASLTDLSTPEADPIRLVLKEFPRSDFSGSLSLFSALGARGAADGYAFSRFRMNGGTTHPERALGPVIAVDYLTAREVEREGVTLRMTAHLVSLPDSGSRDAVLYLEQEDGRWTEAARGRRTLDGSHLVRFSVTNYTDRKDGRARRYRVLVADQEDTGVPGFDGLIRPEPVADRPLVLASLSCLKNQVGPLQWNKEGFWFPHEELVARIHEQDPDMLYFSGDQIYEGDLTGPDMRSEADSIADYLTKYRRFLWAFRDLLRDRPSVIVPDDHDVFHGNLWGAGGRRARKAGGLSAQDSGGYKMPARFVNVVHATQTGNLPATRVSPIIGQGITTYSTTFHWGGVAFAVLSDRMWKDSPSASVPAAKFRNGWIQDADFDPRQSDVAGASLLGREQEQMLRDWGRAEQPGTWTRVVLSQSPFACLHTLPSGTKSDTVVGRQQPPAPGEYPPQDAPVADGDSNGWPQTARGRAVRLLREARALHLCGDQHLGTAAWYGLDAWRDGTVAFTSPAMGNTWPRRWMPMTPGARRPADASGRALTPRYTGDYLDGFGNRVTMLAVANPEENGKTPRLQMNRAPGFGILRFKRGERKVVLEAWPRWPNGKMFPGWPLELDAEARPAGGLWR